MAKCIFTEMEVLEAILNEGSKNSYGNSDYEVVDNGGIWHALQNMVNDIISDDSDSKNWV